jgi:hypothetical protein
VGIEENTMHHPFRTGLVAAAISAGLLAGPIAQATTRAPDTRVTGQRPTPAQQARLGGLALPFIRNTGQVNKQVAFYAPTFAGTAFVTRTGALVLSLPGKPLDRRSNPPGWMHPLRRRGRGWVLTETPVSAAKLTPRGDGVSPTRVSVFQGNEAKTWRTNLKTFRAVRLGQPWPGIRYQIKAHGNTIERIFTVEPGAQAEAIRMRVQGAERLRLRDGRLVAETGTAR